MNRILKLKVGGWSEVVLTDKADFVLEWEIINSCQELRYLLLPLRLGWGFHGGRFFMVDRSWDWEDEDVRRAFRCH